MDSPTTSLTVFQRFFATIVKKGAAAVVAATRAMSNKGRGEGARCEGKSNEQRAMSNEGRKVRSSEYSVVSAEFGEKQAAENELETGNWGLGTGFAAKGGVIALFFLVRFCSA
jgi:hypothetical protein